MTPPPAQPADQRDHRTLTSDQVHRAYLWSRAWVLLALLLTQAVTLSGVLWADRQNTQRLLTAQAHATLRSLVRVTADNVQGYLQTPAQIVQISRHQLQDGLLSAADPTSLTTNFSALLDSVPRLNSVLLGDSEGRFTFVRRDGPDDRGRFIRVVEVGAQPHMLTTLLDEAGRVTSQTRSADLYDPRERPWYRLAAQNPGAVVWTPPYVFSSSRLPGVTVASAYRDANGLTRVIGTDVQLRNLAGFLQGLQISPHGRAFISDGQGHALAASRDWPVSVQGRVPTLREVGDPALRGLLDQSGLPPVVSSGRQYDVNGETYAAVTQVVELQPGLPWMVGVYAPESDFTQALQGTQRQHLLFIALAALVSTLLSLPIILRATRPMAALQRQATTDPLTGLRNRASFMAQLEEQLKLHPAAERPDRHLGVAIFDLDGFKAVNDIYGHPIGDEVLHAVGARMLAAVRVGDILGRLGGDEFGLLVEGNSREEVRLRVEGVLQAVARRPITLDGIQHDLTATAGLTFHEPVTEIPSSMTPSTHLLSRADSALIRGKRREKGRVWVEGEVTMPTLFR